MSDVAGAVQNNKNIIQTVSGSIASIGLEHVGKKVAGALITPATWALNYKADGAKPSGVDVGIYASGFFSAPAAIVTGIIKAVVDDDIGKKLALIRAKEPAKYAPFINACYYYGSSAPSINAMTIASQGGTAWRTSEDLWVYITDAAAKLVADYKPAHFVTLYQPTKPYVTQKSGGFAWGVVYKR